MAPFTLWRTEHNVARSMKLPKSFSRLLQDALLAHHQRRVLESALACAIAEMGVERIMFAVDWPYIDNALGTKWLKPRRSATRTAR